MINIVRLNKNGAAYPPLVFILGKLTFGLKSTSFQVWVSADTKPSSFRRSQAGPSSVPSTVANASWLQVGGKFGDGGKIGTSGADCPCWAGICRLANSASGFQVGIPSCHPRSVGTYWP